MQTKYSATVILIVACMMLCTGCAGQKADSHTQESQTEVLPSETSQTETAQQESSQTAASQSEASQQSEISQTELPYLESSQSDTPAYSSRTVIVSVDDSCTEDDIKAICDKYELSVVYDYQNFAMYALSTQRDYNDQEMADLIKNLSSESHILNVERDGITQLD
jgi:hypothetical protein